MSQPRATGLHLKRDLKYTYLHPRFVASRELRAALVADAGAAHGRLLDIGCGLKPYRELFAPFVTEHIGVDVPVSMHGLSALDAQASALALPFATASFDTVLATEVLEHVPAPEVMLGEIARILRPGGTLILSVPFHEPLHELPYDYYRYTEVALDYLLGAQGLRVREVHRRGGAVLVATYLLSSFLYRHFGASGYPGPLRARPFAAAPIVALCAALQILGSAADHVWSDPYDTLGYVVLAERAGAA
jgi:SAM-dependent methyltransferase